MALTVKFWGTRGSIPTPGRLTRRYGGNTACVEVRTASTTIICDAGSGIRELGRDLLDRGERGHVVHLLLSHAHWDHIQGFPFFEPAYVAATEFRIYDLEESAGRFYRLLSGQMTSEHFPVRFADLKARIIPETIRGGRTAIGDVDVRTYSNLRHPGGSIAYALAADGAKVVYATDNEVDQMLEPPGRATPDGEMRRVEKSFVDFVRGADLLIADAQYLDEEYPNRVGWGHGSAVSAVDLAVQAEVKWLAIFHHDPTRSDAGVDRLVRECTDRVAKLGSSLIVFAAREGVEMSFGRASGGAAGV